MTGSVSARLEGAADQLGIDLSSSRADALAVFLALLQHWNQTYNLTALRDPESMLVQHVYDCLAAISPLRRSLAGIREPRVLDVGSGGGLPGAVIAIVCSEIEVSCIDTVGKKVAFLRQVAAELSLRNLSGVHGRVEEWKAQPFDVITSRAFASLGDFTALTKSLLKPAGVWMAMKGRAPDDEIATLPRDVQVFHVEPLVVPELDAQRCLVWMRHTLD